MVGWHHQLNGHEFQQALGDGEGQEGWRAVVHGITKSQTRLSGWTELATTTTLCSRAWELWLLSPHAYNPHSAP